MKVLFTSKVNQKFLRANLEKSPQNFKGLPSNCRPSNWFFFEQEISGIERESYGSKNGQNHIN